MSSMTAPFEDSPENDRLAGLFWPAVPSPVPKLPLCAAFLNEALPAMVEVLPDSVTATLPLVAPGLPRAAPHISERRDGLLPSLLQLPWAFPLLSTPMANRQLRLVLFHFTVLTVVVPCSDTATSITRFEPLPTLCVQLKLLELLL